MNKNKLTIKPTQQPETSSKEQPEISPEENTVDEAPAAVKEKKPSKKDPLTQAEENAKRRGKAFTVIADGVFVTG